MDMAFLARWLVRLPPLLLLVAALAELIAAPFAWGAAAHVGIPDWMPPFLGVVFGAPALIVGFAAVRGVTRKTRERFYLHPLAFTLGITTMLAAIFFLTALAVRIAEPSTYDSLRSEPAGDEQSFPDISSRQLVLEPRGDVTPSGFLVISLAVGIPAALGIAVFGYIYASSIDPNVAMSFEERRQYEIDGVGEMLRGAMHTPPKTQEPR